MDAPSFYNISICFRYIYIVDASSSEKEHDLFIIFQIILWMHNLLIKDATIDNILICFRYILWMLINIF